MARTPAAKASTSAPAASGGVDMQAVIDAAVAAAVAAVQMTGAPIAVPVETPAPAPAVASVDTTTPEGQPTLRNPGNPASLPQKRLWADLRMKGIAKNGTAAQKKSAAAARTVYEQALNAYLLASGVTGPASVTMGDAQVAISELRA